MSLSEIIADVRNWILFAFAVVGGIITVRAYRHNMKQRRLENSFRMLALFKEVIPESDIAAWKDIFHSTSEPAGASPGHIVRYNGPERYEIPIDDLFSEGPPDNGAIERMAEFFDLIAHEALCQTVDLHTIYFQMGQLMDTIYSWLNHVDNPSWNSQSSFIKGHYPYFAKLYRCKAIDSTWKHRTYDHVG